MIQEGQQTNSDMLHVKVFATWPDEFVEVYLNNYLVDWENEDCIGKLDREVVVIKAEDSNRDTEKIHVPYLSLITLVSLKLPS